MIVIYHLIFLYLVGWEVNSAPKVFTNDQSANIKKCCPQQDDLEGRKLDIFFCKTVESLKTGG